MTDMFKLDGRVALVTGAGRGLGRACALALADAGAVVAAAARTGTEVSQLADDITAGGSRASWHTVDVLDLSDIQRMVDEVVSEHGRIDILVNNAGTNVQQKVLDVTEDAWDLVIDTNLKGAFFCAQAIAPAMVARGSGKIINMASTFATLGFQGRAVYAASKGGLMQLTRVMAIEWASHGVNINAVGPTATRTRMNESVFQDTTYRKEVLSRIPAGRWCEPEDVTGPVVFLASEASNMVNGHLLLVDGGWSAI